MTVDIRIEELEKENAALRRRLLDLEPKADRPEGDPIRRLLGERVVLEDIPDIVCIMDREHRILYLNRTVPGLRVEDRIGTCSLDYIDEHDRPGYIAACERAWATGITQTLEVQTRSGYWWQTRLVPIKTEAGALLLGTSADVTQQKHSEAALRESESRLRQALEATGMGTWTWDHTTGEHLWDNTLCAIFGIALDRVPPSHEEFLTYVHPEDRDDVSTAVKRYVETGVFSDLRYRIIRPDGEIRHLISKGTPVRDEHGNLVVLRGGIFDVTEQRRLEEQLRQVQKMDAIGQLTAGIAHNFNNLLSVILPNVTLGRARANQEVLGHLSDIEHAANRAAEMIRQLMLFARPEGQDKKTPIDIVATARRTVEICGTTFDRKISIDLEAADNVPAVAAHAGQIEQVLLNICLNARDAFAQADTEAPRIQILIDCGSPGMVRIRVSDNGPGMDEKTRSRVFEPFFTTKAVGHGTGLGLASAYAMVTEHYGRIRCESHPGEGSTFELELPVAPHGETPSMSAPALSFERGTGTVLIVDDEPLVRRAVRGILERGGYKVLESVDGIDGLETFTQERENIDLVLLDQSMPGMSGDQVLLKLMEMAPQMPVVLLSGLPGPAARLGHATAVLTKPADATTLLCTIRDGIASKKRTDQPTK
jgi:two-component system, cell cycle sensor histidine kinase and response regulator CckA